MRALFDWLKSLFVSKPKAKLIVLPVGPKPEPPSKPSNLHQDLAEKYYRAEIRPERLGEVMALCSKIKNNRDRYEKISEKTGVPWYVIGAIHHKEASLDFRAYLGNGERIIGTGKKSTIVPKNRGPFETFEEGAIEALGNQKGKPWDLGSTLYFTEAYNGFGYRSHGINSPYNFAATTLYDRGGYPRDHVYDSDFVVRNPGCVAVFRGLGLFSKA